MPTASLTVPDFEAATLPQIDALYQTATALLPSETDAEDAVEETYRRASRSLDPAAGDPGIRAGLFSRLFQVVRERRRLPAVLRWSRAGSPADDVLVAFRQMPLDLAEVVVLADAHGFAYAEIQQILSLTRDAVMARLGEGRRLLRLKLGGAAAMAASTVAP